MEGSSRQKVWSPPSARSSAMAALSQGSALGFAMTALGCGHHREALGEELPVPDVSGHEDEAPPAGHGAADELLAAGRDGDVLREPAAPAPEGDDFQRHLPEMDERGPRDGAPLGLGLLREGSRQVLEHEPAFLPRERPGEAAEERPDPQARAERQEPEDGHQRSQEERARATPEPLREGRLHSP